MKKHFINIDPVMYDFISIFDIPFNNGFENGDIAYHIENYNGKEITAKGHFSYSEAMQAEMFEKDTYKKYPRILIGHRAFTLAARDIASDILFGVMETTELKIVAGSELSDNDIASVEDVEAIEI